MRITAAGLGIGKIERKREVLPDGQKRKKMIGKGEERESIK